MITSTLIKQLRRKYADQPRAFQSSQNADGAATLFNVGEQNVPIMENSFSVYFGTSAKIETTDFTLDKDTGDLQTVVAQAADLNIRINAQRANFRDQHWVDAINDGIDKLNGRGFYRQTVRSLSGFAVSAKVKVYAMPSGAIDVYEVLQSIDQTTSGLLAKLPGNWTYQEGANKIVLGYEPQRNEKNAISFLRVVNKYQAVSATLDVKNEWLTLLVNAAGSYYFAAMAAKIALQGNANIKDGHISYSNLIKQSRVLEQDFEKEARRLKPSRPGKEIRHHIPGGGNA